VELPRGTTGFWRHGDSPPATDLWAFREHCHEAARRAGGRVASVEPTDPGGVSRNFALAVLTLPAGVVGVTLNAHHPLVAFADPPAAAGVGLRFRDCPELAAAFEAFGAYRVASAAEWERPPTPADLAGLAPVEREQVAYWRPRRLGDVAFHWWD
jgi:hypothetical protein